MKLRLFITMILLFISSLTLTTGQDTIEQNTAEVLEEAQFNVDDFDEMLFVPTSLYEAMLEHYAEQAAREDVETDELIYILTMVTWPTELQAIENFEDVRAPEKLRQKIAAEYYDARFQNLDDMSGFELRYMCTAAVQARKATTDANIICQNALDAQLPAPDEFFIRVAIAELANRNLNFETEGMQLETGLGLLGFIDDDCAQAICFKSEVAMGPAVLDAIEKLGKVYLVLERTEEARSIFNFLDLLATGESNRHNVGYGQALLQAVEIEYECSLSVVPTDCDGGDLEFLSRTGHAKIVMITGNIFYRGNNRFCNTESWIQLLQVETLQLEYDEEFEDHYAFLVTAPITMSKLTDYLYGGCLLEEEEYLVADFFEVLSTYAQAVESQPERSGHLDGIERIRRALLYLGDIYS